MKRIFGFIAGAGLGASVLYGVRKLLSNNTPQSETAPWSAPSSRAVTTAPHTSNLPGSDISPDETAAAHHEPDQSLNLASDQAVNLAVEKTSNSLSDETSLVGEPEDRHLEPLAATNTDAKVISPRSDTTEKAVPGGVEVAIPDSSDPINQATASSSSSGSQASSHDNFTPIYGIGEAYNKRLHKAGIHTFDKLGSMSPEEIEKETEIAVDVIMKDDWCAQARKLAKSN